MIFWEVGREKPCSNSNVIFLYWRVLFLPVAIAMKTAQAMNLTLPPRPGPIKIS